MDLRPSHQQHSPSATSARCPPYDQLVFGQHTSQSSAIRNDSLNFVFSFAPLLFRTLLSDDGKLTTAASPVASTDSRDRDLHGECQDQPESWGRPLVSETICSQVDHYDHRKIWINLHLNQTPHLQSSLGFFLGSVETVNHAFWSCYRSDLFRKHRSLSLEKPTETELKQHTLKSIGRQHHRRAADS